MKEFDPHPEDKILVWMLLLMVALFGMALGIHLTMNTIVAPENASKVSDEWSDVMDFSIPFHIRGGTAEQKETIQAAFASLPQCERDAVNKRLHVIVLHKVKQEPDETTWGGSYGFGLMELGAQLQGQLLQRVFLHECGHYFDWSFHISDDPRFEAAIKQDYEAMSAKKKYENHYIKVPSEAMAEMFSFHFTQRYYFDTPYYYDIELFPHAYGVFDEDLFNDCKENQ